jgi:hypothetical protein
MMQAAWYSSFHRLHTAYAEPIYRSVWTAAWQDLTADGSCFS